MILQLNNDIILHIIQYLNIPTVSNLMRTCNFFNVFINEQINNKQITCSNILNNYNLLYEMNIIKNNICKIRCNRKIKLNKVCSKITLYGIDIVYQYKFGYHEYIDMNLDLIIDINGVNVINNIKYEEKLYINKYNMMIKEHTSSSTINDYIKFLRSYWSHGSFIIIDDVNNIGLNYIIITYSKIHKIKYSYILFNKLYILKIVDVH